MQAKSSMKEFLRHVVDETWKEATGKFPPSTEVVDAIISKAMGTFRLDIPLPVQEPVEQRTVVVADDYQESRGQGTLSGRNPWGTS